MGLGVRTRAVRDSDGWLIDGSKTFITNGVHADITSLPVAPIRRRKAVVESRCSLLKSNPGLKIAHQFEKHG
ncbi:MAG: hypothetical protein WBH00_07710 [Xanthobacteraceae bacterium]